MNNGSTITADFQQAGEQKMSHGLFLLPLSLQVINFPIFSMKWMVLGYADSEDT